jgi:hypothetical protein
MWLMTKFGFFSIVKKGEKWHIRARSVGDMIHLRNRARLRDTPGGKIINTPGADYPFRLIVDEGELCRAICFLGKNIDYPNFKEEIAHSHTQKDKATVCSQIWALLRRWELDTFGR